MTFGRDGDSSECSRFPSLLLPVDCLFLFCNVLFSKRFLRVPCPRYCQFAVAMFLMLLVIESLTQIVGVLVKVNHDQIKYKTMMTRAKKSRVLLTV